MVRIFGNMMRLRFLLEDDMSKLILLAVLLTTACGGARDGEISDPSDEEEEELEFKYTAADMVSRAELARAELTTAVDAKRYRAAAPITTSFDKSAPVIYFVGRLKRVPTDATIEVRWFIDSQSEPMLVSDIQGSDNFQFVADFSPLESRFEDGTYSARVFVNGTDIGGIGFSIGNPEAAMDVDMVVSNVKFSTAVRGNMKPKRPRRQFPRGTRKLYVGFDVNGAPRGVVADISWHRGEELFHTDDVVIDGDQRYAVHVVSQSGLPEGEYTVEISVGGQLQKTAKVAVGKRRVNGPTIDDIALGLTLQGNNMPTRRMSRFKRDTSVIQCGLRFLDLPADSIIEIQWLAMEDEEEVLLYRNRSNLPTGGSGTMGAAWEPSYELSPGPYKVAVLVNDEPLGEEAFEIE
jgi:hypothetical protein